MHANANADATADDQRNAIRESSSIYVFIYGILVKVRQIYRSGGPHELRFDMNGGPNILKIGIIKHYRGAEVHEPAHKRMTKIADGVALCDHRNIASK